MTKKEKLLKLSDKIMNDVVTLASIGVIGYLALNGVTDPTTFALIAGLGGYSAKKRSEMGVAASN